MSTRRPSWIVHGPEGCGKTRHAVQIANYFRLAHIFDPWDGADQEDWQTYDVLYLTNNPPVWIKTNIDRRAATFEQVMSLMAKSRLLGRQYHNY